MLAGTRDHIWGLGSGPFWTFGPKAYNSPPSKPYLQIGWTWIVGVFLRPRRFRGYD
jgi:hypothetical protein